MTQADLWTEVHTNRRKYRDRCCTERRSDMENWNMHPLMHSHCQSSLKQCTLELLTTNNDKLFSNASFMSGIPGDHYTILSKQQLETPQG